MTDHHHNPVGLEDVAQPPRASTALAPIADAIARASVTLDRIAADLEAVGTQLGGLEEPHQTEGQRATLLAKAAAWDAMHEALTRNAHGESHASAADVCLVGFAQQEALATHGHHGDVYEPDGPNAVRRVGPDGQRRSLVHMVRHSPTGLNWGYGGSGPADLARSLLLDALGHHDDVADPDGVKDAVEGLYQQFCDDVVAALPKRGWRLEVARVRAWAAAQVPELADTIVVAGAVAMSVPRRLETIGARRPGAVCVDIELDDGCGDRVVVAVWATTVGEAVINAEACCDERLGGDWVISDWRGLG